MRAFHPIGEKVLVRPLAHRKKTQTEGGLHIPERAQEDNQVMEVVALGRPVPVIDPVSRVIIEPPPAPVKVGDHVLVSKHSGVPVLGTGEVEIVGMKPIFRYDPSTVRDVQVGEEEERRETFFVLYAYTELLGVYEGEEEGEAPLLVTGV